jgi:cytochrome c-type biogenesis protein CcmF
VIAEVGHFALILGLLLAALQVFLGLMGPYKNRSDWTALLGPIVSCQTIMVFTAFGCLIATFINHDFSVAYVANNSNSALPLLYRISAVWGAHEGSLVLWCLLLSVWTLCVVLFSKKLPVFFAARVVGVLGIISVAFLLFTLATSNPFLRLAQALPDGRDLNPLLQDPALAIHPPLLYTGYVGFAVAFSFAVAAMLEGKLDQTWARWTRPWTTVAWAFLSVGIALGSWWAYYELGWGGYWFWDPVENASFMPWLVGTALIHSLAVTEKRGLFKSWTLLLAILAFSLSLLGTFLVRSGVLVSVHSFAADPARGVFILIFLVLIIGGALTLYAWRAPQLQSSAGFAFGARESFLLFNNILLVIAAATVFGGTMAPLIADALGLPSLSIGTPYFNPTFLLSMLPLLALVALGMNADWKRGNLKNKLPRLIGTAAVALLLTLAIYFGVARGSTAITIVGFVLGLWIILSALIDPLQRWYNSHSVSRGVLGMSVAHIGLGVFVLAITAVESYTRERDVAVAVGDTVELGSYQFRLENISEHDGANYQALRATVGVFEKGQLVTRLYPEKRLYWIQRSVMTEAGIAVSWGTDLFVALGEDLGAGRWSLRLQLRPLINQVWWGAFIMAFGGILAASDRRYRQRSAAVAPA